MVAIKNYIINLIHTLTVSLQVFVSIINYTSKISMDVELNDMQSESIFYTETIKRGSDSILSQQSPAMSSLLFDSSPVWCSLFFHFFPLLVIWSNIHTSFFANSLLPTIMWRLSSYFAFLIVFVFVRPRKSTEFRKKERKNHLRILSAFLYKLSKQAK
jgi:hypothetical protein